MDVLDMSNLLEMAISLHVGTGKKPVSVHERRS